MGRCRYLGVASATTLLAFLVMAGASAANANHPSGSTAAPTGLGWATELKLDNKIEAQGIIYGGKLFRSSGRTTA